MDFVTMDCCTEAATKRLFQEINSRIIVVKIVAAWYAIDDLWL